VPTTAAIDSARTLTGFSHIRLDLSDTSVLYRRNGMKCDFGGWQRDMPSTAQQPYSTAWALQTTLLTPVATFAQRQKTSRRRLDNRRAPQTSPQRIDCKVPRTEHGVRHKRRLRAMLFYDNKRYTTSSIREQVTRQTSAKA
jgi:hypothetical protein